MSDAHQREKAESVWNSCLNLIREKLKPLTFKTWFEPLVVRSLEDNLLTIEAPSTYFHEWLEEHFADLIQETLFEVLGTEHKLKYEVRVPKQESFAFAPADDGAVRPGLASRRRIPLVLPGLGAPDG